MSNPTPAVILIDARPCTTSLAIAECFSKRHCDVMRDIHNLIEQCPADFHKRNFALMFREVKIGNGATRMDEYYNVFFDGFMLLVMGYAGKKALEMKLAYIATFNAMQEKLANRNKELANSEKQELADAPLTPDQQCTLHSIVDTKVLQAKGSAGPQRRVTYAQIWSRFNNHFRLSSYKQLPQSRLSEAIAYLVALEVEEKRELPKEPQPGPQAQCAPTVELHGKYRDYLQEVEDWRKRNRAEYTRLYQRGVELLRQERTGTAILDAYASLLGLWLDKMGNSAFSVFDAHLESTRAPVILAAQLNASFEPPHLSR